MGCDIHLRIEKKNDQGIFEKIEVDVPQLDNRYYDMFRLFGISYRGDQNIPQIAAQRGIPDDATQECKDFLNSYDMDGHSHNWLTVDEIVNFDYNQIGNYRGVLQTLRDALSERYFIDIETLKASGADRIVFFFDN